MDPGEEIGNPGISWLFEQLEEELGARLRREAEQELAAALRAGAGRTRLWEQVARWAGAPVLVRSGPALLRGTLLAGYADFFVIDGDDGAHHLVRHGPAVSVGLPAGRRALAAVPRGTARRFRLSLALRELARRREPVRLLLVDGSMPGGTIEAVGGDYLELAEHDPGEARREREVRGRRLVGLAAVAVVSVRLPRR